MNKSNVILKNQQALSTFRKNQTEKKNMELSTGDYSYKLWHDRIAQTLDWRANRYWNGDKNWDNAYEIYRGKHWQDQNTENPTSDTPRNRITVNVTASTIQNIGPFLMNSHAEFSVKPRKPESATSATLQQAVLNYEWQVRNCQDQARMALDDALIIGHGICKHGFILELDEAVKKMDGEIVYADYISEESPYVKRICPKNFLFDPTASEQNLATASWCAEIFYVPVRDILANASYDKKVIADIKAGKYSIKSKVTLDTDSYGTTASDTREGTDREKLGVLYEIWDKKFKKYYVFACGVIPPLVEKDWPYDYLRGFPYEMVEFIHINDEPYGVGIPYSIQDQQHELNRKRTQMFNHSRVYNRKYQVVSSELEDTDLNDLIYGTDGTIVKVKTMGAIQPIQDAPLSGDVYQLEAIIKEDVRQLTGADALIQGGQLPSRTTAGEVNARGNLFRAKLDDRVGNVDSFLVRLGTAVLAHIKNGYVTNRVVRIVGKQGETWETVTPKDIQDEVDVTMESVSAPKTDPILDRQQALQILQISQSMLPLIQAGVLKIDMNELFKWVLEKFDIKDAGRFFPHALDVNYPLGVQQQTNLQIQQPQPNVESIASTDIGKQAGLAPILNQSGLQL